MAFKYQALNDSRSSLNSLSSLGSSRSIDSPGGGRQRHGPRLEFSAAGTCGGCTNNSGNRNSIPIMSEAEMERSSFSVYPAAHLPRGVLAHKQQPEIELELERRDGDYEGGVGARSDSNWRQSLQLEEGGKTDGERSTFAASNTGTDSTTDSSSSSSGAVTVLKRKNRCDFSDGSDAANSTQQNSTSYLSSVESETGLYIHSSVRLGGSGLKFSRQLSSTSAANRTAGTGAVGERQPLNHHHNHHHHINQTREHSKLFRVLQKFSNKRAQQRVEMEAEKKARKSPQHSNSGSGPGNRTGIMEREGRDKENVGHQKRSRNNKKNKQGSSKQGGRFPVSRSSDLLSGFSDVVYHDINTEVIDPLAVDLEVEPDTLIYANITTDRLLGGEELSSSFHRDSSRAQKYLSMPTGCEVEEGGGASTCSRRKRASVRRTSSLNEGACHGCGGAMMDIGALTKSAVSRNGSKRKSHDLLLYQGES